MVLRRDGDGFQSIGMCVEESCLLEWRLVGVLVFGCGLMRRKWILDYWVLQF